MLMMLMMMMMLMKMRMMLMMARECPLVCRCRIGALVLRQSALALQGATGQSHLRLNSHMMELSMKTTGAVEALGKERCLGLFKGSQPPTSVQFMFVH